MCNKIKLILLILSIFLNCIKSQQGTYNGPEYTNGLNAGYKSGWGNADLGPLMQQAGIRNQRMSFPCSFFKKWGYNILYDNNSFGSAKVAGQSNFTAFITYDQGDGSIVPSTINLPIWGSDGQINQNNDFAYCVYQIVSTYKADVKIYEIYNEPDYVNNWQYSQTWSTQPPTAAQLSRFDGDIYTYVRLLRIAWEVAKSIDPTCFITVGGLGYPTFFDAVLRYGENSTSTVTGKNYIDAVSTHYYPIFGTSKTNSDAYLNAYVNLQNEFRAVAKKYNFNPKIWIVTETGVQTTTTGGYYGSEILARNYFFKLPSISVVNGVCQNHIFILGDTNGTTSAMAQMGLFYDYQNQKPNAYIKKSSLSLKTWDYHLFNKKLDTSKSTTLQSKLPNGVIGYVYTNSTTTCYLLWANTTNYQYDELTPSINVTIDGATSLSVFNYLNNHKNIDSNQIQIDSNPLIIYLSKSNQPDDPNFSDDNENPNFSSIIKINLILLILLNLILNLIFI